MTKRTQKGRLRKAFDSYWFPKEGLWFKKRNYYGEPKRSQVMSAAQDLRKQGLSLKQALQEAWKVVKTRRSPVVHKKVITLPPSQYRVHDPRWSKVFSINAWRNALKGRGELLAIWHPRPRDAGEKAIIEASITLPRDQYLQLRNSGEFDILPDGVLARRGRKKKATNIFVLPGRS